MSTIALPVLCTGELKNEATFFEYRMHVLYPFSKTGNKISPTRASNAQHAELNFKKLFCLLDSHTRPNEKKIFYLD